MIHQLRFGAPVVTAQGHEVGTLYRAVIADTVLDGEQSSMVTAITVQQGIIDSGNFLKAGGWDKPRDLVVSIAHVAHMHEDKIALQLSEEEFHVLPPYITAEVIDEGDLNLPPSLVAEDAAMRANALLGGSVYEPHYRDIENRAAGEHHVSHATSVWQQDPHTHVGDLDRLFVSDDRHRLTALVIRRGVLLKHEVILPANSITEIYDDRIHIALATEDLHGLQEYNPEGNRA